MLFILWGYSSTYEDTVGVSEAVNNQDKYCIHIGTTEPQSYLHWNYILSVSLCSTKMRIQLSGWCVWDCEQPKRILYPHRNNTTSTVPALELYPHTTVSSYSTKMRIQLSGWCVWGCDQPGSRSGNWGSRPPMCFTICILNIKTQGHSQETHKHNFSLSNMCLIIGILSNLCVSQSIPI